ncbi:hypothetical protein Syun_009507 [Stephania yunnanensis]|uniref:Uncharacterized protein n=1 Tax=Stephania yunnanensis TaxID=152371 RepID=A0AAP0KEM6_9MAGN
MVRYTILNKPNLTFGFLNHISNIDSLKIDFDLLKCVLVACIESGHDSSF